MGWSSLLVSLVFLLVLCAKGINAGSQILDGRDYDFTCDPVVPTGSVPPTSADRVGRSLCSNHEFFGGSCACVPKKTDGSSPCAYSNADCMCVGGYSAITAGVYTRQARVIFYNSSDMTGSMTMRSLTIPNSDGLLTSSVLRAQFSSGKVRHTIYLPSSSP